MTNLYNLDNPQLLQEEHIKTRAESSYKRAHINKILFLYNTIPKLYNHFVEITFRKKKQS